MNNVKIVVPKNYDNKLTFNVDNKLIEPFSDILLDFINDVSKQIFKDTSINKNFPELIALAYWMRKSHINKLKEYFNAISNEKIFLGRGVVFHIAPSNVDTIFVYSWFISLLVGNSNIVRISEKANPQTDILLEIINSVLEKSKYLELKNKILVLRYGHIDDITKQLSLKCDVRVIWGGDSTVNHIRKIPIKPTSVELSFANKFSFCILNSKTLIDISKEKLDLLIKNFYNDSFLFSQMACSSIRLVIWVGNDSLNEEAKKIFWNQLNNYVNENKPEDIQPADIINKIVSKCSMAIESNVQVLEVESPYIHKVNIEDINNIKENLHCGSGLFYELETDKLNEIFSSMTKKHQTISYFGFNKIELTNLIKEIQPYGIDRIVPIGKSLEFSNTWDGFDLFKSFSREIEIL